jgi:hypothetical protein
LAGIDGERKSLVDVVCAKPISSSSSSKKNQNGTAKRSMVRFMSILLFLFWFAGL